MSAECTQNESEWKEGSAELLLILVSASIATHSLPGIALVGTQPDDSESVRSSFNLWEVREAWKLSRGKPPFESIWGNSIPAKVGIFKAYSMHILLNVVIKMGRLKHWTSRDISQLVLGNCVFLSVFFLKVSFSIGHPDTYSHGRADVTD